MHYAAARGKAAIMKLLLDHGARIDLADRTQATTLHFSTLSPACTKLTIKRGDLIHAQDRFCRTALHYAALVEEPNIEVRNLLLAAGIQTGTVDLHRQTAQFYYDTHALMHFDSHEVGWFICTMMYEFCFDLTDAALCSAVDSSRYYNQKHQVRFEMQIQEKMIASAEAKKTWTLVSDSDDEDLDP